MRGVLLSVIAAVLSCWQASGTAPQPPAGQPALQPLQGLVGQWRGVGQIRRGSTQGAWTESSTWAWQFSAGAAALTFQSDSGKYFSAGRLTATGEGPTYRLRATSTADQRPHTYVGTLNDRGTLVLQSQQKTDHLPSRISMRLVADDKRLIMLFERQSKLGSRYFRLSEVGYTRRGSNFGKTTSQIECVVTGGRGTIPVTYEGQTYYVCCGGCRDYFNENPAAVLAEYRERRAAAGRAPTATKKP